MKKEEKQLIYNLLKTADCYVNGYQSECFTGNVVFQDDPDIKETAMSAGADNKGSGKTESVKPVMAQVADSVNKELENENKEVISHDAGNINGQLPLPQEKHSSTGITMEQLNAKMMRCTRCGLARTRHNVVTGEGVPHPDVIVIGEGPGYDEDMQGHPFVGRAGQLLDKMLHAIYLDRNDNCFIGNIVKCRPPQNRNPFPDEQDACFPFLETQIHILKPKMILCLGKVAIEKLMNRKISINACHGQFFDYNGITTMVTYHPSALLRNEALKGPAWEDLKGFSRKLDSIKIMMGEKPVHHRYY